MSLTFNSHLPGTLRFSYTARVVGLDTRPPHGIPTGTITIRVIRGRITFLAGTFIGGYGNIINFLGEFRHLGHHLTIFRISRALNS